MRLGLRKAHIRFVYLALVALIASIFPSASSPRIASAQTSDPPANLLANTVVSDWSVADPRLIWLNYPNCPTTPPGPKIAGVTPQAADDPVTINRVSTSGSSSRTIYARNDPRATGACNPYTLNSNIVADANYVYWMDGKQLVRLPVTANPGDAAQPVGQAFPLIGPFKLVISKGTIAVVTRLTSALTIVYFIDTTSGVESPQKVFNRQGDTILKVGLDETYLYVLTSENGGLLFRALRSDPTQQYTIASPVKDFVAEGTFTPCSNLLFECSTIAVSYVFYAIINNTNAPSTIQRFNNKDNSTHLIYTSTPPNGQQGQPYGLTLGQRDPDYTGADLFFFEQRATPCLPCLSAGSTDVLTTISDTGASPTQLYVFPTSTAAPALGTTSDGTNLYWQEGDGDLADPSTIKQLPTNAAALPKINLVATGLEITQGVQKSDNSVPLIQDRRTFVRFFVHSVGASVPAAKAQLTLIANGTVQTTIEPINPNIGSKITVVPNPDKGDIDQSFLFELPSSFLGVSNLRLQAVVNPFHIPEEPNYADNVATAGPFTLQPSPRLVANMVSFSYNYQGTNYGVDQLNEIAHATSLVRRMYPLASTPGFFSNDPDEPFQRGFRPLLRSIADDNIGTLINYTVSKGCNYLLDTTVTPVTDYRNRCATEYVLGILTALRDQGKLPNNASYGFIPYPTGLAPRGWAYGGGISAGPSDASSDDSLTFDSLAFAHELGHDEGRSHPFTGSKDDDNVCGNKPEDGAYDRSYPYKDSFIGPGDGSVTGFDSGDNSFANAVIPTTLYADTAGHDIMGYCRGNRWISDYTYNGIYTFMMGKALRTQAATQQPGGVGDWLNIVGAISPGGNAQFLYLRRVDNVADTPARQPGAYSIHLLDGAGNLLANYPFTPMMTHHGGGAQNFSLVVPFVAGTREVRLVTSAQVKSTAAFICNLTTSEATTAQGPESVLARQLVSSNPPVVSDVALQNPPTLIAGTVTLGWNASDPDGDALTFDVLYSRDGGATFQPLHLNVTGTSLALDTTALGGGSTIFQVVASDGVQSAHANSAPVTLAAAPPRPRITNPGDGTHVEWGQVVNFNGEASDAQDGSVSGTKLVWSDQHGTFGTGAVLTKTDLRVGANVITLTATNSAGLSASTTITVTVGDDLTDPGPTFSVAPSTIGFDVAPGTTQPVTAQLDINNAGGGTLAWAISSDASWLSVSASSGTAPASVTVTANPSGFSEGQTATATLTLTSAAGVQPVSIPVTLSVGNTVSQPLSPGEVVQTPGGNNPPSGGGSRTIVYLPVVVR